MFNTFARYNRLRFKLNQEYRKRKETLIEPGVNPVNILDNAIKWFESGKPKFSVCPKDVYNLNEFEKLCKLYGFKLEYIPFSVFENRKEFSSAYVIYPK